MNGEAPPFFDRALLMAVALRVAVLGTLQIALVRAYYGTTNMYLKVQAGFGEDGTPRFEFMHTKHLLTFDLLVLAFALVHRRYATTRAALGFAAPSLALVAAGWLNVDPPVGRAFIAALALVPLVAFAGTPLPPVAARRSEPGQR
jgi:hypothetical protein